MPEFTKQERAALAVWVTMFNEPAQEPLRERAGALTPGNYCMRLAAAVAVGGELPEMSKGVPTPWNSNVVRAAQEALSV